MPWNNATPMDERLRLAVLADEETYTVSELAKQFGVSRKTAYKWIGRHREGGVAAMNDRSRAPLSVPGRTPEKIERLIVKEREKHPTWGGKKIHTILRTKHGLETPPCIRTVDEVLRRNNLVRKRRRRGAVYRVERPELTVPTRPHEVMTVDFKGWFTTGDGEKFEPLTITDLYSHYLLRASALQQSTVKWTRRAFSGLFRLEGVPEIIRVDNGAPFGSVGPGGLTKLSVWWVSLGIEVQFTRPGCPQDNGSHERMHRTMKDECCKPASCNRKAQQQRMDRWRHEFNHERPHESLDQRAPAELYQKSARRLDEQINHPLYEPGDFTLKVSENGVISHEGRRIFVGEAYAGQRVALEEEKSEVVVCFSNIKLGFIPGKKDSDRLRPYPYEKRWKTK